MQRNLQIYLQIQLASRYENVLSKFSFFHRFLNLMGFSSDFVFSTRVYGVDFWPHLGSVKCKMSRSSGGFSPEASPGLFPGPVRGLQHPRPPAACLWHDKHNSNSPLISQRPQNSFCTNLQLAKCVWAIYKTRALFQVSPV